MKMTHQPVSEPAAQLRNAYTVTMMKPGNPRGVVLSRRSAKCPGNGLTLNVLSLRTLANLAVARVSVRGRARCEAA